MPCYDGGPSYPERPRTYNGLTSEQLEAALCAVLTMIEADADSSGGYSLAAWLSAVDWKEAGVTRKQVTDWWKAHKAADRARREREERQERLEMLKTNALKKLTPAERAALGL